MRADNWGWRARIGLFIVGNEAVPEAEWWAMAPPGVSVHAARVTAPTPWATWNHNRSAVALADDMLRGARQFAAMKLQAVVVGHSASSILGGEGWDEAVVDALSSVLPGVAVSTNGIDCIAALRMMGVSRPLLVLPPWFGLPFLDQAAAYCAARGAAPSTIAFLTPGPS
jgi:maleate isomerase